MGDFLKYLGVIPQLTYILKEGETMYSRMEKNHGQKVQRFSIRKYSFGAASVAVAAYMMFGGAATVQAQEHGTSPTVTSEQVNSDAGNQADSSKPVDSTETSTSTVATHQQLNNQQTQL